MSERMTGIRGPGARGYQEHGRKTRAEMIAGFRDRYAAQKTAAEHALALSDDELVVETYLGSFVKKDCIEVLS